MQRMRRGAAITAVVMLLVAAAVAVAATPTAGTGGARDITESSATVTGTVNPNGEATTFYFEYGPTKTYGSRTPDQGPTAAVKANQPVSAALTGLSPDTTYHYRLVAVNPSGTKQGGDKAFKTKQAPPSVTLGAVPAKVTAGGSSTLSGKLTPSPGKSPAGVKITLEVGGKAVATATADATGLFSFKQSPGVNTTYTAVAATNPKATSAPAVVGVRLRVTLQLSTTHPKRGKRVTFSGTVSPARTGQLVRIQKKVSGKWRTVKTGVLQAGPAADQSSYSVAVRVRTKGTYRAYAAGDAANLAGASRGRVIRPR